MRKIILIILLLIPAFFAEARHHKHKKSQQTANQIISVAMRRTGCYGRCPDYTVEINKDGMVTYTGRHFTTDTGTFEKNIGSAKAMEVIGSFITYKVDTCSNTYPKRIADLPGTILTIQYGDHVKTINNANFGPYFLKTLATQVDDAGNKTDDIGWKKINAMQTK